MNRQQERQKKITGNSRNFKRICNPQTNKLQNYKKNRKRSKALLKTV